MYLSKKIIQIHNSYTKKAQPVVHLKHSAYNAILYNTIPDKQQTNRNPVHSLGKIKKET